MHFIYTISTLLNFYCYCNLFIFKFQLAPVWWKRCVYQSWCTHTGATDLSLQLDQTLVCKAQEGENGHRLQIHDRKKRIKKYIYLKVQRTYTLQTKYKLWKILKKKVFYFNTYQYYITFFSSSFFFFFTIWWKWPMAEDQW